MPSIGVVGELTVWASPYTLSILVCVCAAKPSAKGLGEGEYGSAGVVIIKYPLSQTHHWSHSSETAVL